LKIKLKGGHFDTNEVMEANPQAVQNMVTDHGLKDAFKKNGKSAGNGAFASNGTTSRVMVASKPKDSF
jgi:hypothetical protein